MIYMVRDLLRSCDGAAAPSRSLRPWFEHDACGLAALVRLDGRPAPRAGGAGPRRAREPRPPRRDRLDPDTGDGAGIMTQLPHRFLRAAFREAFGHDLPPPGAYATGLVFLPRDPGLRMRCEELCVRICAEEGQRALGWRDPPVHPDRIGRLARASEPVVRQLFVERRTGDQPAFERKLYVIRRRVERAAAAAGCPRRSSPSSACRRCGWCTRACCARPQLAAYYDDLRDPRFESALALVHSRFSTNTFGTWDLADPFNLSPITARSTRCAERQLAGRARAAAALGAPGRRSAEALPDRRRALVGLGQAGRRGRAPRCSAGARWRTR